MSKFDELKAEVLEDGIIDAAEVAKIKEVVYEDGKVDAEEAAFLFEINDAVSGKENAPEWAEFFVTALTDYVLADEATPGVVDAEEAASLIELIKGDGVVDANELALMVNIITKAESCDEAFIAFALESIKAAVIADGVVDADEVSMLRSVIYAEGGDAGADISRAEADLLFDINDVVSGKDNAAEWCELFVEAIAAHLLNDETSPNEVDEEEGDWLVGRIESDGEYDAVEKALLSKIKETATKIDGKLQFKMDFNA